MRVYAWRWPLAAAALLLAGALLRGLAVPAGAADLAPAARFGRLHWPRSAAAVRVWFPDATGRFLIPVWRAVASASPAAALAELAAGPAPGQGLLPTLPAGSRARVQVGEAGHATVDLTGGQPPLPLQREALIRTVAGAPGVGQVSIRHDGVTLAEQVAVQPPASDQVTVYYLYRGLPLPVARGVQPGEEPMASAARAVLGEPPPAGVNWLPGGVEMESLRVKGSTAHVRLRFSPELGARVEAGEWNFAPYYMALVYTLTEFPGIERVQLEFQGLTAAALRQCRTPLAVPLVRPEPEPARGRS